MGDDIKDEVVHILDRAIEPLETKEIEDEIKNTVKKESVTRTKVFYRLNLLRGEGRIKGKFTGPGKGVWIWWRTEAFKIKKAHLAILALFIIFFSLPTFALTSAGLSLVLEHSNNNSLVSGYHNLTIVVSSQNNCTNGIFYNQTFVNGIYNGRSNVTMSNLPVDYNTNYYLCYWVDGILVGGIDNSTIG
ncbi:MAG: hypothetical protein V1870_00890 [Candidatus Aenigmatarchaeota archaeon]